jgi:hypothetical protein
MSRDVGACERGSMRNVCQIDIHCLRYGSKTPSDVDVLRKVRSSERLVTDDQPLTADPPFHLLRPGTSESRMLVAHVGPCLPTTHPHLFVHR